VLSYFILLILARRDKTRLHPAGLRLLQNCRYIINKQIMTCVFPTCTWSNLFQNICYCCGGGSFQQRPTSHSLVMAPNRPEKLVVGNARKVWKLINDFETHLPHYSI